ncbi:hypothetical protein [Streptomyces sp. NPDC088350]|uniref:hypothetical protein n=1 Tax=Streptomyces sp. NPDC088350 TaxID=3365854 RepID=UPI0037F66F49
MNDLVIVRLDGDADESRRECADVLYCVLARPDADAWLLAGQVLARYPGCLLVLVPRVGGGWAVRVRLPGFTEGSAAALRGGAGPAR